MLRKWVHSGLKRIIAIAGLLIIAQIQVYRCQSIQTLVEDNPLIKQNFLVSAHDTCTELQQCDNDEDCIICVETAFKLRALILAGHLTVDEALSDEIFPYLLSDTSSQLSKGTQNHMQDVLCPTTYSSCCYMLVGDEFSQSDLMEAGEILFDDDQHYFYNENFVQHTTLYYSQANCKQIPGCKHIPYCHLKREEDNCKVHDVTECNDETHCRWQKFTNYPGWAADHSENENGMQMMCGSSSVQCDEPDVCHENFYSRYTNALEFGQSRFNNNECAFVDLCVPRIETMQGTELDDCSVHPETGEVIKNQFDCVQRSVGLGRPCTMTQRCESGSEMSELCNNAERGQCEDFWCDYWSYGIDTDPMAGTCLDRQYNCLDSDIATCRGKQDDIDGYCQIGSICKSTECYEGHPCCDYQGVFNPDLCNDDIFSQAVTYYISIPPQSCQLVPIKKFTKDVKYEFKAVSITWDVPADEPTLCLNEEITFSQMPDIYTLREVQALRYDMTGTRINFDSSREMARVAHDPELSQKECAFIQSRMPHEKVYDPINQTYTSKNWHQFENDLSLRYDSCDMFQGKVTIPLLVTSSVNPEVFIYMRNNCSYANALIEYQLQFELDDGSSYCTWLKTMVLAEYVTFANSALLVAITAVTLLLFLLVLGLAFFPFGSALKKLSTSQKPFNLHLFVQDGRSRIFTVHMVVYVCGWTLITFLFPMHDATLDMASFISAAIVNSDDPGNVYRYSKSAIRGFVFGLLSFGALQSNFSIPDSGGHGTRSLIAFLSLLLVNLQLTLQTVWVFAFMRRDSPPVGVLTIEIYCYACVILHVILADMQYFGLVFSNKLDKRAGAVTDQITTTVRRQGLPTHKTVNIKAPEPVSGWSSPSTWRQTTNRQPDGWWDGEQPVPPHPVASRASQVYQGDGSYQGNTLYESGAVGSDRRGVAEGLEMMAGAGQNLSATNEPVYQGSPKLKGISFAQLPDEQQYSNQTNQRGYNGVSIDPNLYESYNGSECYDYFQNSLALSPAASTASEAIFRLQQLAYKSARKKEAEFPKKIYFSRLKQSVSENSGFRYSVWVLASIVVSLHVLLGSYIQSQITAVHVQNCIADPLNCVQGISSYLNVDFNLISEVDMLNTQASQKVHEHLLDNTSLQQTMTTDAALAQDSLISNIQVSITAGYGETISRRLSTNLQSVLEIPSELSQPVAEALTSNVSDLSRLALPVHLSRLEFAISEGNGSVISFAVYDSAKRLLANSIFDSSDDDLSTVDEQDEYTIQPTIMYKQQEVSPIQNRAQQQRSVNQQNAQRQGYFPSRRQGQPRANQLKDVVGIVAADNTQFGQQRVDYRYTQDFKPSPSSKRSQALVSQQIAKDEDSSQTDLESDGTSLDPNELIKAFYKILFNQIDETGCLGLETVQLISQGANSAAGQQSSLVATLIKEILTGLGVNANLSQQIKKDLINEGYISQQQVTNAIEQMQQYKYKWDSQSYSQYQPVVTHLVTQMTTALNSLEETKQADVQIASRQLKPTLVKLMVSGIYEIEQWKVNQTIVEHKYQRLVNKNDQTQSAATDELPCIPVGITWQLKQALKTGTAGNLRELSLAILAQSVSKPIPKKVDLETQQSTESYENGLSATQMTDFLQSIHLDTVLPVDVSLFLQEAIKPTVEPVTSGSRAFVSQWNTQQQKYKNDYFKLLASRVRLAAAAGYTIAFLLSLFMHLHMLANFKQLAIARYLTRTGAATTAPTSVAATLHRQKLGTSILYPSVLFCTTYIQFYLSGLFFSIVITLLSFPYFWKSLIALWQYLVVALLFIIIALILVLLFPNYFATHNQKILRPQAFFASQLALAGAVFLPGFICAIVRMFLLVTVTIACTVLRVDKNTLMGLRWADVGYRAFLSMVQLTESTMQLPRKYDKWAKLKDALDTRWKRQILLDKVAKRKIANRVGSPLGHGIILANRFQDLTSDPNTSPRKSVTNLQQSNRPRSPSKYPTSAAAYIPSKSQIATNPQTTSNTSTARSSNNNNQSQIDYNRSKSQFSQLSTPFETPNAMSQDGAPQYRASKTSSGSFTASERRTSSQPQEAIKQGQDIAERLLPEHNDEAGSVEMEDTTETDIEQGKVSCEEHNQIVGSLDGAQGGESSADDFVTDDGNGQQKSGSELSTPTRNSQHSVPKTLEANLEQSAVWGSFSRSESGIGKSTIQQAETQEQSQFNAEPGGAVPSGVDHGSVSGNEDGAGSETSTQISSANNDPEGHQDAVPAPELPVESQADFDCGGAEQNQNVSDGQGSSGGDFRENSSDNILESSNELNGTLTASLPGVAAGALQSLGPFSMAEQIDQLQSMNSELAEQQLQHYPGPNTDDELYDI